MLRGMNSTLAMWDVYPPDVSGKRDASESSGQVRSVQALPGGAWDRWRREALELARTQIAAVSVRRDAGGRASSAHRWPPLGGAPESVAVRQCRLQPLRRGEAAVYCAHHVVEVAVPHIERQQRVRVLRFGGVV